jgi:dihydrofolate reductase
MRKVIAITQISLDGIMQGPGGPEEDPSNGFTQGGWAMSYMDDDSGRAIGEILAGPFDLLLGRTTYNIWAGYWPQHGDNPIGEAFNRVTKYVATRRADSLDWKQSQRLTNLDEIRRLKSTDGPPLHVWGSSVLLQSLIAADLIDEHRLWIFPLILGHGKRLFEPGIPRRTFTLVDSRHTPGGVFMNTYRPVAPR